MATVAKNPMPRKKADTKKRKRGNKAGRKAAVPRVQPLLRCAPRLSHPALVMERRAGRTAYTETRLAHYPTAATAPCMTSPSIHRPLDTETLRQRSETRSL